MSENRSYSRGKVNNVVYNDRCGYAIIFYEPIYDLDTKIAPLRMKDLPHTIPLQRKALHNLKPAGKPVSAVDEHKVSRPSVPGDYEAAQSFIQRKIMERKMDEIREACFNARQCYKKAEKYDLKRREVISPRMNNKFRGKSSDEICDILVDDVMQNVDYVYEKSLEEKGKTQRKLALAALRRAAKAPKKIEKLHPQEPKMATVTEEDDTKVLEKSPEVTKEQLEKELAKSEDKFEAIPWDKNLHPSPPRRGLQNYSDLKRRHMDVMNQRAADALLFEMTYGRMLRRLKSEIRRIRETYGP